MVRLLFDYIPPAASTYLFLCEHTFPFLPFFTVKQCRLLPGFYKTYRLSYR